MSTESTEKKTFKYGVDKVEFDGVWAHDDFFHDVEEYVERCMDEDLEPDSEVELCRIQPLKMDAGELIDRTFEVNEVDQELSEETSQAAKDELQALLNAWSHKHLNHWAFPTGEKLNIVETITQLRKERLEEEAEAK